MIRRSLTGRLLAALLAAQVGAIMLAMLVFPLVAPFVSYDDIAETTFRSKIEASIARAPSGGLEAQKERRSNAMFPRGPAQPSRS